MTAVKNSETPKQAGGQTSAASLFDRPEGGERAVVVQLDFDGDDDFDDRLEEFRDLAVAAGADVVAELTGKREAPHSRFYLGPGKVDELVQLVRAGNIELVLVNHAINPGQERNLEKALQCRVLDRTGLILDIFAQRARSHEGKLQVELAQLRHMASRLVRGWSHLERQKGGIGLRGPGETQLELDRRMLGLRIKQLERKLKKVRKQRDQGRQARRKRDLPAISLVGYTNAGKSTIFNRLTESHVYAADQLFATLDTTLRRLETEPGHPVIVADTVGFVRELPHQLVAAFRSTLEEVIEADLLLHVIDASDPRREDAEKDVEVVLEEIGANEVPVLKVFNKIDRLEQPAHVQRDDAGRPLAVWVSAHTGEGLPALKAAIAELTRPAMVEGWVDLAPSEGRARARLYALGAVDKENIDEQGRVALHLRLARQDWDKVAADEGLHLVHAAGPVRLAGPG